MTESTETRLAAERTALSWRRTCLGCLVVDLLLLRLVLEEGWDPAALLPGIACLVLLSVAALGYRRSRRLRVGPAGAASATIGSVTLAMAVVALVIVGYVMVHPGPPG
ncbi:DUF202 domain-containing protein [Nocardia sp. NPDC050799]|uniref:DUF202 domain-containing protein n=1 Tax=Nocardia sp. NPDC050799 TaxID=3154842 RepID=UPI0033FDB56C